MSAQQRPSSIPRSGGALCLCDQVSSTNEGNQATLEGRANGVPKPPSGDPWPCDSSAPPVSGWRGAVLRLHPGRTSDLRRQDGLTLPFDYP